MTYKVRIRATCLIVTPGQEASFLLEPLLDMLTYEDEFIESTRTLGYLYDEQTDQLFIHKGVSLDYLKRLLLNVEFVQELYHPYKEMTFEYEEIIAPRNEEQVDVINFITGLKHHADNINDSQLFLVKKPGFGKTYCSGVGLSKYKTKTLIIMHRNTLRGQWGNSLFNMSGYSNKEVHEIDSSEELFAIAHNTHSFRFDYDVFLMTHATFRAGIKRIGNMADVMKITENLGIGMKIIDEAHLEFRDTLLMDFCFNVKRNIYLTATDGRSSKDENAIFRHVFANATYYKESSLLSNSMPKKWVEYNAVSIDTKCNPAIYRYRVAGGRGMNNASYGKWVIAYDKRKTHMRCVRDIVQEMFQQDQYAKLLIFVPLIELCNEFSFFLKRQLDNNPDFKYSLNIQTINSSNSKRDNEYAKKNADVIVTTISSCGTGEDIPGVTGIISCSPFVSKITAEQVFGRIRYCGKICQYYDIYDLSVQMDVFWHKSRRKKFKQLALNSRVISWVIDEEELKKEKEK